MRLRILASIAGLCVAPHLAAQAQPVTQSYPVVQGNAYKFEQIADGVNGFLCRDEASLTARMAEVERIRPADCRGYCSIIAG